MQPVFADKEIIGKFHLNFLDSKIDKGWLKKIDGAKNKESILIIQSSKFGVEGKPLAQLPIDTSAAEFKKSLLAANQKFSKVEKRKNVQ